MPSAAGQAPFRVPERRQLPFAAPCSCEGHGSSGAARGLAMLSPEADGASTPEPPGGGPQEAEDGEHGFVAAREMAACHRVARKRKRRAAVAGLSSIWPDCLAQGRARPSDETGPQDNHRGGVQRLAQRWRGASTPGSGRRSCTATDAASTSWPGAIRSLLRSSACAARTRASTPAATARHQRLCRTTPGAATVLHDVEPP